VSSRSAAIAARFDARASEYERYAGLQRAVAERLATLLPDFQKPRVLEVGCGTGLFSRHLLARYENGTFLFSDLAPAMLDECRRNLGDASSGVSFETALPEGPRTYATFDLIALSMSLHWFPDPEATLASLRRRLAPGGKIVYATLGPESFTEWRAVLAKQGLRSGLVSLPEIPGVVEEERLTPDTSALGFLRRMKSVGGITPREAYRPLTAGALRRAIRTADARFGGKITWHIVYGVLEV
jgi:malonyl-CoA O-methyltransferase